MHCNSSKYFANRNLLVDLLSVLFGIGAWLGINSLYLQLPLLVSSAPEKWTLPSYMVVVIQLGNIGPLVYTLIQMYSVKKLVDAHIIYLMLMIGSIASISAAFTYHYTAYIAGEYRSVALLSLTFTFALVGCTSAVLFMPYMGRFREIYLITYLAGEGLGGFLSSCLALIQGVGGNAECIANNSTDPVEFTPYIPPPRFNTQTYFIIIFLVMLASSVAFILLNKLKMCKKEYAAVIISKGNDYQYERPKYVENEDDNQEKGAVDVLETSEIISKTNHIYLLFLIIFICIFGNAVFPSVQSYSCLPYGNIAYHLTMTLSYIANPIACFMAIFLPHTSTKQIYALSICASVLGCYTLTTAVRSPTPPLVGTVIGEVLVVLSWTILTGLISYVRLSIITVFRFQGGKSLVWVGALSQTGSLIGAFVTFALITQTKLFISYEPCSNL